jgi:prepilin-type processing-associated H-X9-DG protein
VYSCASETVLLGDSCFGGGAKWHCAGSLDNNYYSSLPQLVHEGMMNVAYYDGHGDTLSQYDMRYNTGNHFKVAFYTADGKQLPGLP